MHLRNKAGRRRHRHHSFLYYSYAVLLGILWTISVSSSEEYRRVSRKLFSSPEPDLDGKFSNEDLRHLLTLLEGKTRDNEQLTTTPRAPASEHKGIPAELMRVHSSPSTITTAPTTSTTSSPPSKITTRRIYRRLRRKTTTTPAPITTTSTEFPIGSSSTGSVFAAETESARALPTGSSPSELFQQLTLLNGILGALNASASPSPALPTAPNAPSSAETLRSSAANANNDGTGSSVPDILAILTGAKNMVGDASSKSETVIAPPPPPSSSPQPSASSLGQQVDDPAAALAILNLFSNGNNNANTNANGQPGKETSSESNSAAAILNLLSQTQSAPPQPSVAPSSPFSDSDAGSALTKLLLQSATSSQGAGQPMQSNSIVQQQHQPQPQNAEASANQLTNLLGILGTLGAAAGQQQQQSNSINNLFNLGGDQIAQAQTPNHLATLFGGQQQQQQQNQAQNLLALLGGSQGNQGFGLANLLGAQAGNQNAIPGLGLLSTVSSLGTTLLGTVSNIFSGSRDGKPRVRGKGVDTRVGLGYRLGNIGDAQVVWDIGPQLFTDPLRNEMRPYTQKRESGAPAGSSNYLQPSSATATEKEVQQIEAKRRMVQAAVHDHYRHDHFASVYPKQAKRRSNPRDYHSDHYSPQQPTYQYSKYNPSKPKSSSSTSTPSFFFSSLPFADHFKGFWSGLTSGMKSGSEDSDSDSASKSSQYYNFDDVRADFSANLIKRSSPDYTDYESRAYHPRRLDDEPIDDPNHSTLTEYERMLLQYGKKIGEANTQHGVVEEEQTEPEQSESNIFSKWFKNPFTSLSSLTSLTSSGQSTRRKPAASEWDSIAGGSNEYASHVPAPESQPHQKSVKKTFRQPSTSSSSLQQFNGEASYTRRNEAHGHPRRAPNHRPQKRKSHNPFRNFITSLKTTAGFGGSQTRPRPQPQAGGFGRRHFKKASSANPKLQHFTNTNKDLMMADATDDFVYTAGRESVPSFQEEFQQPFGYSYADEFPDVSLTNSETSIPLRRRVRPTPSTVVLISTKPRKKPLRATLSQSEKIIEPALLYDHLEVLDADGPEIESEADESFHSRNKVVVDSKLREIEKQKVLGTVSTIVTTPTTLTKIQTVPPGLATLQKIQRLRLNKLRESLKNGSSLTSGKGKKRIVVKIKGNSNHKKPIEEDNTTAATESTTILPTVISTISSIFSGTTKPKLRLSELIRNASSLLPSISSIRILPRKKKKDDKDKTRLTVVNGKPTILGPPDDSEEEDELEAGGTETQPIVQVGHDMDFSELQKLFEVGAKNSTKKKRIRLRVKESILKGETVDKEKNDKERKESDEDESDEDQMKDIFVDIESGEVSVLKPVASLVSFSPKKEEKSEEDAEEDVDYYEDDDGDGIADMDMKRKEHIFNAIQKQLVSSFEKMRKKQLKAEQKKRRKQELAEKGMDEAMDDVTKFFDLMTDENNGKASSTPKPAKKKNPGGLSLEKKR